MATRVVDAATVADFERLTAAGAVRPARRVA